ncbi:hypothetical protein K1T71_008985 [Dendrolimus kikuchii]|uniref:Uncharacterized protein n=1 Tax=Dendrolimus kikuchii TaxID=765133 RepID=A0ACC1CW45_9NEOP|nr:hypothetical protein K1T71_008985 [Dendrolimus kikuchii]
MNYIKIVLVILASFVVIVYTSSIYHENTVITYRPDVKEISDYFGYSVVLNKYGLIVGAPKARSREDATINSGLVYNCSLSNLDVQNVTCYPMGWIEPEYFRQRNRRFIPSDFFRDDMWFGATIASLTDGKILICAPRWAVPFRDKHLLANGVCYLHKHNRDGVLYLLKEQSRQAFLTDGSRKEYGDYGTHLNFYAYGEAGMSITVSSNNYVIVGAPGLMQWTGGIVSFRFNPSEDSMFISKQPMTNPYFTKDLGPDDYFGYSVETGIFQLNGSILYVGGAPRSKLGYGQVLIFEPTIREQDPLNIHAKIKGPQLGSYFGASLCTVDIDGDGRADLLVGAPTFVKKDGELPYDQGAVFVYMTKETGSTFVLKEHGFVSGSGASGARFGATIAELGDVDGDGFKDVAIGAPWENEGLGVVYIYKGYDKGLRTEYIQRIMAKGTSGFGMSISKGLDVDHNNCNDLAIGAHNSSTVYLYRCVPTMQVHASVKVPDAMNLPVNVTSFTALFCVSAPPKPLWSHVKMNLNAKIVIDPEMNRATINGDSEYGISIKPGHDACDEQIVEVKPTADLSVPISIKFELQPVELMQSDSTKFLLEAARLSEDSVLHSSFLIQLIRDCGEDMICTPWLVMRLEPLEDPYVPGLSTKFGAKLTVLNKEEPAYGAKVTVSLPYTLKRVPSECNFEIFKNSTYPEYIMVCDLPAPLHRDEQITWEIELEPTFISYLGTIIPSNEEPIFIYAVLEDSLFNRNITDNAKQEIVIDVQTVADFAITGKPLPNATMAVTREKLYNSEDIVFEHYYQITNYGPSDWSGLQVEILFPDEVELNSPLKGCEDKISFIKCTLSVAANVSMPVVLELKYNLSRYGEDLRQNMTYNITTTMSIEWYKFKSLEITTTLVLDPAPPIWPIILGLIAGLLALAAIIYILYKCGFFTRTQLEELKKLQEQDVASDEEAGTSNQLAVDADESTHELICDDSD